MLTLSLSTMIIERSSQFPNLYKQVTTNPSLISHKKVFEGKNKEEAINRAKIELQEIESNLLIRQISSEKGGLFKNPKIEIEVIERRQLIKYIKEYINDILKKLGFNANIEVKNVDEVSLDHLTK